LTPHSAQKVADQAPSAASNRHRLFRERRDKCPA
jgi:hypothetical protein